MSYVFIIGAPRSGTNMLRDMLVKLDGVGTWPCDEINYIWRHGNLRFPSDQFTRENATPKVKKFIEDEFYKFAHQSKAEIVIEKTCANSLRVDFIDEIFPDAKFIFIERDPFDVVGSAKLRWTAKLDIPYILKKVRYVPLIDLPFYGGRYLWHRIVKVFSKEKRLGSWGPVLPNMQNIVKEHDVLEVCAIQWKECVKNSKLAFANIADDRVFKIGYEEFVNNPVTHFKSIANFINKTPDDNTLDSISSSVSSKSVGKGKSAMTDEEVRKVSLIVKDIIK